TNIGGDFTGSGSPSFNYGVRGTAAPSPVGGASVGGVFGANATSNSSNYGIQTGASGAIGENYGIYTTAAGGTNSYGIYASNPGAAPNNWAGYFQGDVNINGTGYITSGFWLTSDQRYKQNIKKLESVNDKIKKLSGYTYNFKADEFKEKNFDKNEQIGLIAQELKEVFPQLVKEGKDGYLAVNYQGMIPVLLEAVKEQQKEIEDLKALVKGVGASANGTNEARTISTINLSDVQAVVLEQNVPNPFAEQTSIGYTLPEGVQKAQILFYNAEGKLINTSTLKAISGKGQLNVFASDLSSGLYNYTLIIDDKIIDTKKMIKQN
ncbi:MAG TPA: tail fiber domain-containing protein, partial [Bacteroidia bacterium]|nr:tail fiber domain-containing protein [Bacteroidia bacterium]